MAVNGVCALDGSDELRMVFFFCFFFCRGLNFLKSSMNMLYYLGK